MLYFFLAPKHCGILATRPGIEPASPVLKDEVLTTGLPGKSPTSASFVPSLPLFLFSHEDLRDYSWPTRIIWNNFFISRSLM